MFSSFARWTERQAGRSHTFAFAVGIIVVWAVTGPFFHWSDTWQLIINTGTTIVTFLMVFLIQQSQNRDTQAIQLKLDELIRVNRAARNSLIELEDMSEEDLQRMREAFVRLAKKRHIDLGLAEQAAELAEDALEELDPSRREAERQPS
jgi:low affinity Fe/Cu permease